MDYAKNWLRPYIVGESGAEGLSINDNYPEMWDVNAAARTGADYLITAQAVT